MFITLYVCILIHLFKKCPWAGVQLYFDFTKECKAMLPAVHTEMQGLGAYSWKNLLSRVTLSCREYYLSWGSVFPGGGQCPGMESGLLRTGHLGSTQTGSASFRARHWVGKDSVDLRPCLTSLSVSPCFLLQTLSSHKHLAPPNPFQCPFLQKSTCVTGTWRGLRYGNNMGFRRCIGYHLDFISVGLCRLWVDPRQYLEQGEGGV